MLPKNRRLTRQEFWQVTQNGKSIFFDQLVVKFTSNNLAFSRWAIVTSTKLAKRAVIRNKLRRKIYNTLRIGIWDLGFDVIIFPRPSMLNLDNEKLGLVINQVVSKISSLVKRT